MLTLEMHDIDLMPDNRYLIFAEHHLLILIRHAWSKEINVKYLLIIIFLKREREKEVEDF